MHELLGFPGGFGNGLDVSLAFDGESLHRLACGCDAVDHFLRPSRFDSDHDHCSDIRIFPGSNDRPEKQFEICPELKPSITVGDGQGPKYIPAHCFSRSIGNVIHRKNDDVVTDSNPAIFPPVTHECF